MKKALRDGLITLSSRIEELKQSQGGKTNKRSHMDLDTHLSFYAAVKQLAQSRKKWRDAKIAIVMVDSQEEWMIVKHRDLHNGFYEEDFTFEGGGLNHPTFWNN